MTPDQIHKYVEVLRKLKSPKLQERRRFAVEQRDILEVRLKDDYHKKKPVDMKTERLYLDWSSKKALCDKEIVRRFMETTFVKKRHL